MPPNFTRELTNEADRENNTTKVKDAKSRGHCSTGDEPLVGDSADRLFSVSIASAVETPEEHPNRSGASYSVERDSLRERERQARAQIFSQGSDPQEVAPMFKPPVRVSSAVSDPETQQIQSKLGDFRYVKHFLDDPKSSIGVYGEPASPAPGGPPRGIEFKKPHHTPQNGRPPHRPPPYTKLLDPLHGVQNRIGPPRLNNGKTPPSAGDPNGVTHIETILNEMKSVVMPPLTAIAATPRKETESKFNFNMVMQKQASEMSHTNNCEPKPPPPPKPNLERHNNPRSSADLERDLSLSDSEDEKNRKMLVSEATGVGSTSGSESSSSDSDSDTSSDDSKPNSAHTPPGSPAPSPDEPPPAAGATGSPPPAPCRPSWGLINFAPPPAAPSPKPGVSSTDTSSSSRASHNDIDSGPEVEHFLQSSKPPELISSFSESDDGSNSERGGRILPPAPLRAARRSPRTPARPRPPSSPSGSDDDAPPPRPEEKRSRGRPRKPHLSSLQDDAVKKKRGRPRKSKVPVPARPPRPPSSSSDEGPPPVTPVVLAPPAPQPAWRAVDSDGEASTVDKKKNDTLRKLFAIGSGAKGGGKNGGKGGKGKGQVLIVDVHSMEHDEEADRKEEDAHRRAREEEEDRQRRLKEEELARRRRDEEAERRRLREEVAQRRLREREEAERRRKQLKEAEAKRLRDEEVGLRRRREEEIAQQRLQQQQQRRRECYELTRRTREEEARSKPEDEPPRRVEERPEQAGKVGGDTLQQRLRESEDRRPAVSLPVRIDLDRLSSPLASHLRRARAVKRLPPPPPAPPDKKPKLARQNPESTPTNHERAEPGDPPRGTSQPLVYYSYLDKAHQDGSSDDESREHTYYLSEAKRLKGEAGQETTDLVGRVMLYQESVLCFVLTGRMLEELDTKKAFTVYRETMEYIKSIHSMPVRHRASPQSTLSKLDILSLRCQALLYLRMFKMYKGEVKEYFKIFQEYCQKPACPEVGVGVGTVSPLSPTPSPAGSVGSVGSAGSGGSSGYGSGAPALTPQHTPGGAPPTLAVPGPAHQAMLCLTKYYTYLDVAHDLWDQADSRIRSQRFTELFINVDRVCGPLSLHSSFRHLVKYVRHAISLLKAQGRHAS